MSKSSLKLYKVDLIGLHFVNGIEYGSSFVVATDPTSAYEQVRKLLNEKELGSDKERELDCVTLFAENNEDSLCGTLLFLPDLALTDEENLDLPDSPEIWVKDFISGNPPIINCAGVVENDKTRLMKALLAGAKFEHRRHKEIDDENERLREDIRGLKNAASHRNELINDLERRIEELTRDESQSKKEVIEELVKDNKDEVIEELKKTVDQLKEEVECKESDYMRI